jgi:hypothetical protein
MFRTNLSFAVVALAAVCWGGLATAQQPAALPEAPSVMESMEPAAVAAPAVECCPIAVVGEVASFSAKRSYRCNGGPVRQVLCVDNPADCCCKLYSVPVCVPACCVGEPVCCGSHVGLLGRGYVTYRWPCGFEATIAFRVHGGVLISYR